MKPKGPSKGHPHVSLEAICLIFLKAQSKDAAKTTGKTLQGIDKSALSQNIFELENLAVLLTS
ncbi:unnamed protein product [Ranitomeya imitator]|uniref:Uncharacterized protein n=1 Tax=Ranitomeya imitator TaxID=111125 RepID=A0ABN9LJG3_9NEOB|nr:unnamed protein product [Ranitomeya imitator]